MRRLFANVAEVIRATHNAATEVMLPQAISHHLGGHRVLGAGDPFSKHAAFTGSLAGVVLLGHVGLRRA